jgi:hypothetical protein
VYTPPRNSNPKPERERSGLYLPLWSVVVMVVIVLAIAGGIILLVIELGGPANLTSSEPRIVIITVEPTSLNNLEPLVTPTAFEVVTRQPAQTITLTGPTLAPTSTFTPTPAVIAVGSTVIVVGDGGVNVRSGPSRGEGVVAVANQGDQFTVIGGPQEGDGLTFWQLQSDDGISGWAAEGDGAQKLLEVVP